MNKNWLMGFAILLVFILLKKNKKLSNISGIRVVTCVCVCVCVCVCIRAVKINALTQINFNGTNFINARLMQCAFSV